MRWWGWGDADRPPSLQAHALGFLRETLGVTAPPKPPVALRHVCLDQPSLSPKALALLNGVVGQANVRGDHVQRVLHAAGKGYPDLIRLRAGNPEGAPDAVVYPATSEQLVALLALCSEHSIAVVPFGGGTSVVGGLAPLRGEHETVLALDMKRMSSLVRFDRGSLTVTAQAGLRVSELERLLAPHGATLGHFPQSFEYVSLGGCAATRSAGQASSGYGRFEEMVRGLAITTPAGRIELPGVPASAAGPSLRELIVGSEGTLGVIDELVLRVRPRPSERLYEGFFFESFDHGIEALREMAQARVSPDVARLSDETETEISLALAPRDRVKSVIGRSYLRARGYERGCLAILGFEGDARDLKRRRAAARVIVRRNGGLPVGRAAGRAWLSARFQAPYLRDELITHGLIVETLETATCWSNLLALHRKVAGAIGEGLRACATPGTVGCHVSHIYETGASLYFTFLAPARAGGEVAQWQAVKAAATQAIVDGGGTITHHHAVGRDHAPWLETEIGREGVEVLRAVKAELDPAGIMNPGKMLP